MSMPSDVSPDVTEALDAVKAKATRLREETRGPTSDEVGLAAAALVAFAGIAILGPAITRLLRPKSFKARMADKAAVARTRVATAAADARKKSRRASKTLRRLGGGTIPALDPWLAAGRTVWPARCDVKTRSPHEKAPSWSRTSPTSSKP